MLLPMTPAPPTVDAPDLRRASRDQLSVALMDARNHTLHALGRLDAALGPALAMPVQPRDMSPPLWVAGRPSRCPSGAGVSIPTPAATAGSLRTRRT